MKEKMLITGVTGFLGGRAADYYKEKYEIIQATHRLMDITDEASVYSFLAAAKPDIVLHCAAVSDTGLCERQPERALKINVQGTLNLGSACVKLNSRMIFMSSDQIYFDSSPKEASLYQPLSNQEDRIYNPSNRYGQYKLLAEKGLLNILPSAVCLRLTWMYDLPARNRKTNNNLLCGLLNAFVRDTPISVPVFDYRGITDVAEVVANLEKAVYLPGGIYNFGSGNTLNSYETACRVAELLSPERVKLIIPDRDRFLGLPRNLLLNQDKAREAGIIFSDTVAGFENCLREYGLLNPR